MARKGKQSDQRRVASPVGSVGGMSADAHKALENSKERLAISTKQEKSLEKEAAHWQVILDNMAKAGKSAEEMASVTAEQEARLTRLYDLNVKNTAEQERQAPIVKAAADHEQRIADAKKEAADEAERVAIAEKKIEQSRAAQKKQFGLMDEDAKSIADKLQMAAAAEADIADKTQLIHTTNKEDRKLLEQNISDRSEINDLMASAAATASKLTVFEREALPHADKIREIKYEINLLMEKDVANLTAGEEKRLAALGQQEKQYQALQKLEIKNERIKDINKEIQDIVFGQNTAFGKIMSTLKDIVTNPLAIFTGILAVGVQRYETMRQRGNQLAEEMDRVNKKLAGAGPFQDKILSKATAIEGRFFAMGEGFAQSMESAVDAITALSDQFGFVDAVSAKLVGTMAELKLSIGLSDDESAKVLDNFMAISGMSEDAAISATDMTYQLSEYHGLNPAEVFKEIAGASGETLANFSGSTEELYKAAVQAKRMGITLDDMAKVSESLLDFETSIEKEMEAQLITGMNLDFSKARRLAMAGDEAGAVEEIVNQVGGLDKFNLMKPHQQKALADATGLTVAQLRKTNIQREREAEHAQQKHDLVEKQYQLAEKALPVLGKLDQALGVMERIAMIIGDLFLDVFGTSMKDLEKDLFAFLESPAFKTGFKTVLYTIKGIIEGIWEAIKGVGKWIDKLTGGSIGQLLSGGMGKDFSGSYEGAEDMGKSIGKYLAIGWAVKKTLGTFINPMWVKNWGAPGGSMKGLFSMFKGGGGIGGKFYKGGQFMPGGMRAPKGGQFGGAGILQKVGTKVLGGPKVTSGLTGLSSSAGMAMGGYMLGAAAIGKGIYDVATLDKAASGKEKGVAKSKLGGALVGAAIGTAILPGIGTGVGAAIGYIGGMLTEKTTWFDDELDTSRKNLIASTQRVEMARSAQTRKLMMEEKRQHLDIRTSFMELSGGTKDLTDQGMALFKKKMIAAGHFTEETWKEAIDSGAEGIDFMTIASNNATSALQGIADERAGYQQEQMMVKGLDIKGMQADMIEENVSLLANLSKDEIRSDEMGVTDITTNWEAFKGQMSATRENIDALTKESIKMLEKQGMSVGSGARDTFTLAEVEAGVVDALGQTQFTLGSGHQLTTDYLEDVAGSLQGTMETKANIMRAEINKETIQIMQDAESKFPINEAVGEVKGKKVVLTSSVDDNTSDDNKARGGLLHGPSHADGGINTKFGEMEGGEAVINKRSTAMFMDQLSKINQAGGGVSFGDGGIMNKYNDGGKLNRNTTVHKTGGSLQQMKNWFGEKFDATVEWFEGGPKTPAEIAHTKQVMENRKKYKYVQKDFSGHPVGSVNKYNMYNQPFPDIRQMEQDYLATLPPDEAAAYEKRMMDEARDSGHLVLDLLGFIPGFGEIADLANAAWYAAEGNYADAALSAAAAVPGYGWLATGTKLLGKGKKATKTINTINKIKEKTGVMDAGKWLTKEGTIPASIMKVTENKPLIYGGNVIKTLYDGNKVVGGGQGHGALGPGYPAKIGSERGGITAHSPIKRVNDAILMADGGLIEPHPDDNIVMKKGGITQKTGGNSRVEELLQGILNAVVEGGDVYMDGTKVSSAINSANYNA